MDSNKQLAVIYVIRLAISLYLVLLFWHVNIKTKYGLIANLITYMYCLDVNK